MFQKNELVQYGAHGVCRIIDLEVRNVNKKMIEYYILEPIEQSGTRYYVPTQNKAAAEKLHTILTHEEIDKLLSSGRIGEQGWINDENLRKQRYREVISSGNRIELIQMIHVLYQHKSKQQETGKRLHLCDENFLRDAKKILDSEFSLVLGIPQEEIGTYVQKIIASD